MSRLLAVALLFGFSLAVTAQDKSAEEVKPPKEVAAAKVDELAAKEATVVNSPQVVVAMREALKFTGSPIELEKLEVTTVFGAVSVPLTTIAGIHFASSENDRTTIELLNGDSITGMVGVDEYKLATSWGQATVHAHAVESITMVPDMSWISESAPGGMRWKLTKRTAAQPANTQVRPSTVYRSR